MPSINDLYPSKFLKSSDIKGTEPTYVIASLEVEEVGDGRKPVLYFQNEEKGMVLNRTNADTIAQFMGENTDDWLGREITVCVMRVQGPNGMTDGLRVKEPLRRPPPQRSSAQPPRGNGNREHVVEQRKGYSLSTTRQRDPIEEALGDEPPPHDR